MISALQTKQRLAEWLHNEADVPWEAAHEAALCLLAMPVSDLAPLLGIELKPEEERQLVLASAAWGITTASVVVPADAPPVRTNTVEIPIPIDAVEVPGAPVRYRYVTDWTRT